MCVVGKRARQELVAPLSCFTSSRRLLYLPDQCTPLRFLADTGAEVSIIPARPEDRRLPTTRNLQAANGTLIPCFGERSVTPRFCLASGVSVGRQCTFRPFCLTVTCYASLMLILDVEGKSFASLSAGGRCAAKPIVTKNAASDPAGHLN